ncbi:N-acetylmuramoyl-L-alanine amidase [Enterococcus mundtii]|uniref:N-acetylmuramoyl-L-alanine amidase n=1 Tax=Enterococcus mundtii TaxID=53346 RepID=A0A2S7RU88_ENTMU|nr:N-acetylmuramoyl-L-alanine amidase [Enterococcus mundtii]PQF23348.1 N-acetylmuramoyl-L-alanine amidase [Enterococcus mundtii]
MTIRSNGGGHGGRQSGNNWMDPGAVGNGRREADVVRTITQKMQAIASVANTSDQSATTVNQNLQNQVNAMNSAGGGWAITNHLNAFNGQATGAEVWYWAGNEEARKKAAEVSAAIAKALGIVDRGAKATTSLFVHRNTNSGVNVLLIEWCFIDNANDMRRLDQNMDQAIHAVMNVLGYNTSGSGSIQATPQTHDQIILGSPPKTVGNYVGKLEVFNELSLGIFRIGAWLVPINGAAHLNQGYVFWMDADNPDVEIGRCRSAGIIRDDVNAAYGLPSGLRFGLDGTLDIRKFAGKRVFPMLRRTNDPNGNTINGQTVDIRFPEYVLTIPKR